MVVRIRGVTSTRQRGGSAWVLPVVKEQSYYIKNVKRMDMLKTDCLSSMLRLFMNLNVKFLTTAKKKKKILTETVLAPLTTILIMNIDDYIKYTSWDAKR